MEKIICVYAEQKERRESGLRQKAGNILGLACPVTEKTGTFLAVPLEGYVIHGMTAAEISEMEREEERSAGRRQEKSRARQKAAGERSRFMRRRRRRFRRTMKNIKKRVQKKELQDGRAASGDVFLFYQWRECIFRGEFLMRYYRKCFQENVLVFRAEQLIFLDGWEEPAMPQEAEFPFADPGREEEGSGIDWESGEAPELMLMREIYSAYNYVTIVTDRGEAWQEFAQSAYEEYGLSVRCAKDSKTLTFREKKTLIADMSRTGKKCCGNFPRDSVYMDLCGSRDKARRIPAKCGEIPYLSLRKTLDTVMKDTV